MAKRKEANVFSLSFLDIMSCGFGAVILIFIVINHATETTTNEVNARILSEVKKYEEQVEDAAKNLIVVKNTVDETEDRIVTTEELALQLLETIKSLEAELNQLNEKGISKDERIEELKSELKKLELETADLEGSVAAEESAGTALRSIIGEGERQYLTGLRIGGQHILILLDASASMLDKTIVNVIRRRNLDEEQQRQSPKWQRAVRTVEWILSNLPREANFQLITFNTKASPAVDTMENHWFSAINRADSDSVVTELSSLIPSGGSSLHTAFAAARKMEPQPDNIFLIIDSLPTVGSEPQRLTLVESRTRIEYFTDSLDLVPRNSTINVILFPMEGDPIAAPSYWRLAQITGGSFLSPPEDWP